MGETGWISKLVHPNHLLNRSRKFRCCEEREKMLPYRTPRLKHSVLSSDRNLSFLETLWFEYSAEKSDYFLYCHNTIFCFIFYTILPLP
ncbi:hypothetical protein MIMGU_mgv11b0246251mg, partial [Erythranthe guttata]